MRLVLIVLTLSGIEGLATQSVHGRNLTLRPIWHFTSTELGVQRGSRGSNVV
jgi:hypothetical protein